MNALLAELGIVCPRCDAYNAPKTASCVQCASPLGFYDAAPEAAPQAAAPSRTQTQPPSGMPAVAPSTQAVPSAPKPATAAAPSAANARFRLVALRGTVGPGAAFKLAGQSVPAGRSKGLLLFPNDPFVAPLHCTFFYKGDKLFVRDEGSVSGTFVSVTREVIAAGSFFAIGDTLLRYVGPLAAPVPAQVLHYGAPLPPQPLFLVEEVLEGLRPGRCLARVGPVIAIGQTGCEFIVTGDANVAPRHCELAFSPQGATLRDLSSPSGTFLRMAPGSERELKGGEQVRLGNEVLRVEAL